jgi:hypothetical protein
LAKGEVNPGIEAHAAGNRLSVEFATDYPDVIEDQFSAGFSHFSLASALLKAGRRDEAQASYRRCLSCWQTASAAELLLAPPNILHNTINVHFDAVHLNGQQSATEAYRDAIKQLSTTELYGAWTNLVNKLLDDEFDGIENLEDIPQLEHLRRAEPLLAEYVQEFRQVIDALARDDVAAAQKHLEGAAAFEKETPGTLFELLKKTPVVALHTKSYQFLLGHARALEKFARQFDGHLKSQTNYSSTERPK